MAKERLQKLGIGNEAPDQRLPGRADEGAGRSEEAKVYMARARGFTSVCDERWTRALTLTITLMLTLDANVNDYCHVHVNVTGASMGHGRGGSPDSC